MAVPVAALENCTMRLHNDKMLSKAHEEQKGETETQTLIESLQNVIRGQNDALETQRCELLQQETSLNTENAMDKSQES